MSACSKPESENQKQQNSALKDEVCALKEKLGDVPQEYHVCPSYKLHKIRTKIEKRKLAPLSAAKENIM